MEAVILAAGLGSRIREFHTMPKGFIRLGEQTIIEKSIEKLHGVGINKIVIVTGYAAHHYDEMVEKHAVEAVFNPHFEKYGSLYSLYCAREKISDDCLILESDIIYEKRALELILSDKNKNTILLSGKTNSDDEVYVEAENQQLIRMSKNRDLLDPEKILGEFVGINKLSLSDFQKLMVYLEKNTAVLVHGHYEENGLVAMTRFSKIHCLKCDDLLWSEIDNLKQYKQAQLLLTAQPDRLGV